MPQKKYLRARISSDLTLTSNQDVKFNSAIIGDIPYNSNTGVFTLEQGKAYRITLSASVNTEGYLQLRVVDATDNISASNSAIWTDLTRSWREASAGPLDTIITPCI